MAKNTRPDVDIGPLMTEARNPRSMFLDSLSTFEILWAMNREDRSVTLAVRRALPQIANAVDAIVDRLRKGGRLIYVGTGTSGRIGVLDAVECPPTFNTPPSRVQGVIAGGYEACYRAVEASEDEVESGIRDLRRRKVTRQDVVVGIAASGRTPYTCGALRHARSVGAKTIAIVNNPDSEMKKIAHITIEALTGPEVIAGSTRLKAGTAQKMICNMLSTAAMVRLGAVYSNLMIQVHLKNQKLVARGIKILQEITGVDHSTATRALEKAEQDLKAAAIMLKRRVNLSSAKRILGKSKGNLRKALES